METGLIMIQIQSAPSTAFHFNNNLRGDVISSPELRLQNYFTCIIAPLLLGPLIAFNHLCNIRQTVVLSILKLPKWKFCSSYSNIPFLESDVRPNIGF